MTVYPTCSTCKHWEQKARPETSIWTAYGECGAVIESPAPGVQASVLYDALSTLPSFGCVMHSDLTEAGA